LRGSNTVKSNISTLFILLVFTLAISLMVKADTPATYSTASSGAIETVQKAYLAYYGRPGDPAGVNYWALRLDAAGGSWTTHILDSFGNSEEFQSRFGSLSTSDLIANIYRQLFNREPEQAGLDFFISLLNSRQSSLSQISVDILNGAMGDDASIITNKLLVCQYFSQKVADGMSYDSIEQAKSILTEVTSDSDTVSTAYTEIDTPTPTSTPTPTPTPTPAATPSTSTPSTSTPSTPTSTPTPTPFVDMDPGSSTTPTPTPTPTSTSPIDFDPVSTSTPTPTPAAVPTSTPPPDFD